MLGLALLIAALILLALGYVGAAATLAIIGVIFMIAFGVPRRGL